MLFKILFNADAPVRPAGAKHALLQQPHAQTRTIKPLAIGSTLAVSTLATWPLRLPNSFWEETRQKRDSMGSLARPGLEFLASEEELPFAHVRPFLPNVAAFTQLVSPFS